MKSRKRHWEYYRPGDRLGQLEVLSVETKASNHRNTIYRVRYDCCGSVASVTHERINHRVRLDITACGKCAQGGWRFFDDGEIVTGYEILARVSIGRQTQKKTTYRVKALCCGKEFDCTHYCLTRRNNDCIELCRECSIKKGKDEYTKQQREKRQETRRRLAEERRKNREDEYSIAGILYGVRFRPEWPRPSWIPKGAYILWEDRMQA